MSYHNQTWLDGPEVWSLLKRDPGRAQSP